MSRSHDVTISGFDLDRLEAELRNAWAKYEATRYLLDGIRALCREVDGEHMDNSSVPKATLKEWREAFLWKTD